MATNKKTHKNNELKCIYAIENSILQKTKKDWVIKKLTFLSVSSEDLTILVLCDLGVGPLMSG